MGALSCRLKATRVRRHTVYCKHLLIDNLSAFQLTQFQYVLSNSCICFHLSAVLASHCIVTCFSIGKKELVEHHLLLFTNNYNSSCSELELQMLKPLAIHYKHFQNIFHPFACMKCVFFLFFLPPAIIFSFMAGCVVTVLPYPMPCARRAVGPAEGQSCLRFIQQLPVIK